MAHLAEQLTTTIVGPYTCSYVRMSMAIHSQFCLIMLYNILKQNTYLPPAHIPEFHLQTSQYQLQTRSFHMFRLTEPFCNTDTYMYSFIPYASKLWNSLPPYIIESSTIDLFKLSLRNYYITLNK